jgi:phosphohistidine phosphatase
MMVYFVRHGIAEDAEAWPGPDSERPLTNKGRAKMASIAKRLAEMDVEPDAILTSPLVRARETADIVAKALRATARVEDDTRLAGGFDPRRLVEILNENEGKEALMLVGHEPNMSAVIGHAIGDGRVELKKGAVACVEFHPGSPRGQLLWLAPPRILTG